MKNPRPQTSTEAINEGLAERDADRDHFLQAEVYNARILRDIEEAEAAARGERSINALFYDMIEEDLARTAFQLMEDGDFNDDTPPGYRDDYDWDY